jgi:hypothetical protein
LPGIVTSIIDTVMRGPEGRDYASLTMAGLDPRNPTRIYEDARVDFRERALQYWPETITDSIEIGWNFKDIGGGSGALAQWASNGGRTITFDVNLSRLMAPVSSREGADRIFAMLVDPNSGDGIGVEQKPYNVNIVEYIKFLRGFCYPTYTDIGNIVSALPPPVMILNIPNFNLNEAGGDAIYCVMTGCDVSYVLSFPDGTPRRATVSLTLRQIVQTRNGVQYAGFGSAAPIKYDSFAQWKSEGLDTSAGRKIGNIDPEKI